MLNKGLAAAAVLLCLGGAPAFADCIDYSPARGKAQADALAARPPAFDSIGLPPISGLTLDAVKTVGDPKCDGPVDDYWYVGRVPFRTFVEEIHPFIAPRITVDGMNRQWYNNPYHSDDIILSSGTVLGLFLDREQNLVQISVKPASPSGAPSQVYQPYSVNDIVSGTPWVGGQNGNFIQVGAEAETGAASSGQGAATAETTPAACPGSSSSDSAETVGKEVGGRVLGGGWGRSLGGTVGGLLGSRKKTEPSGC
jgi:hypothetical protein